MLSGFFFQKHLEDDETLVAVVHKHWLFGIKTLFWPTAFLAAGATILFFNQSRGMVIVMGIWSFVFFIWWLRNFFDYFLDAWIITDQGIIDIAWHGWFHRQSTRTLYSDLQSVSYEIEGLSGTVLRYGTISIEKISTGQAISLENVHRPKRVELLVLKCQEAYLHSKNMKDAKQIQTLLASIVAEQMQLHELSDSEHEQ